MHLANIPDLHDILSLKKFKISMRVDEVHTSPKYTIVRGHDLRNGKRRYQFTVWSHNEVIRVAVIK